jgi:hypothetical protein
MDCAGLLVDIEVSHGKALQIAVESDAYQFTALIDRSAAVIAAAYVGSTHKIELSYRIQRFAGLDPTWRHQPGTFVVLAVIEAAESGCVRLRYAGAVGVPFDYSELDAGGAGAVGVIGGAEEFEAEAGDFFL